MKILVITSHYPPYHVGGYEIRCKNVLDLLENRGHELNIIASDYTNKKTGFFLQEKNVYRNFHLLDSSKNMVERVFHDYRDLKFLNVKINSFKPDLVYLWNTVNLTRAIFPYLSERDLPIIYDEGGIGLIYSWIHGGSWYSFMERESKSRVKSELKLIVKKIISKASGNLIKTEWKWPKDMLIYFNSQLGLENSIANGVPVKESRVIYSGLDIKNFPFRARDKINLPIRIVVPGRIEEPKGQLDSVLLLQFLCENKLDAHLILVGKNNADLYYKNIEKTIKEFGLEPKVLILPMVNPDELISLYHQSDVCLFPSYHRYGFSRIPLEAMACGCLVITYGNEGSNEIIENGETGHIVSQQDFQGVSDIIQTMQSNPSKYQEIIYNARKFVEEKHTMDAYVDRIESLLLDSVNLYNQPVVYA